MRTTIVEINKELKELQRSKNEIEQKEVVLMDSFYSLYSIPSDNRILYVHYYGTEYVVTDINFDTQEVCLETAPYQDENEVVNIGFLTFDEVFREYHNFEKIEWNI